VFYQIKKRQKKKKKKLNGKKIISIFEFKEWLVALSFLLAKKKKKKS
jgi:hypothetical protein